ncbi:hypothetical protein ACFQ6V_23755, partial [Streptomyces roseifaciens]
ITAPGQGEHLRFQLFDFTKEFRIIELGCEKQLPVRLQIPLMTFSRNYSSKVGSSYGFTFSGISIAFLVFEKVALDITEGPVVKRLMHLDLSGFEANLAPRRITPAGIRKVASRRQPSAFCILRLP